MISLTLPLAFNLKSLFLFNDLHHFYQNLTTSVGNFFFRLSTYNNFINLIDLYDLILEHLACRHFFQLPKCQVIKFMSIFVNTMIFYYYLIYANMLYKRSTEKKNNFFFYSNNKEKGIVKKKCENDCRNFA